MSLHINIMMLTEPFSQSRLLCLKHQLRGGKEAALHGALAVTNAAFMIDGNLLVYRLHVELSCKKTAGGEMGIISVSQC